MQVGKFNENGIFYYKHLNFIIQTMQSSGIDVYSPSQGKPPVWRIHINSLRPRQNGRHFADDIFKSIFMNENV